MCDGSTRDRLWPGRTRKPPGGCSFAGTALALTFALTLALMLEPHLRNGQEGLVVPQRVPSGKRSLVHVADRALAVPASAEQPGRTAETLAEQAPEALGKAIELLPDDVQAHVFVASLAFLLDRALEKKLKSAQIDISSEEAWELLKTVRVVEIDLGNGEQKQSVTHGSARAARILKAVGVKNLDPDTRSKSAKNAA